MLWGDRDAEVGQSIFDRQIAGLAECVCVWWHVHG